MTHTYIVTIRRIKPHHAIRCSTVVLPVHTSADIRATEVIDSLKSRWKAPWQVVGIERSL